MHLTLALCVLALATLFPHRGSAQQVTYYDFNTPQAATPSQTSTSCGSIPGGPSASNVLFCFNYTGDGLSYIQDFYPPGIDPNASTDADAGSNNYALQVTANAGSEDSSMWYSIPQDVADGFNAWYAVKLTHQVIPANYFTGDGLAFVIQNAAGGLPASIANCAETGSGFTVLGGLGGCLGYGGIDNSVALEMDTFWDSWDPEDFSQGSAYDDNHLALQSCGLDNSGNPIANSPAHFGTPNCLITLNGTSTLVSNPNASLVSTATPVPVTLADGNVHQVVVIYNGPNDSPANYIYAYLDAAYNPGTHTPVAGSVPLFSGPFDITKYIKLSSGGPPYSPAYIGFTAATGGDYEQHEVMAWSFTPHAVQQSFGNVNVCPVGLTTPAPCSSTFTLTYTMAADTTIGSVKVVTQGTAGLDFKLGTGSTCTGTISAGNSCTVNVTFAPLAPGLRMGAVELFDNSGNQLASSLIYGVGQGPAIAFGPGTQTRVNTGAYSLSSPKGATVDAAGNVFISDNGNQRVVKVAPTGTVTTVGFGLQYPQGLAVDGAGDVFIADNNLNEVVEVPAGCVTASCQTTVGTGLLAQLGVAVDGVGDVFMSDFTGHQVVEVPAGCTTIACQTVVYSPGSTSNPVGVTVDAAGDLFVADYGLKEVVKIPPGCTSSSCQTTVGTGWAYPEAVAVDAAGDVFVADEAPKVVEVPAGCTNSACQITLSGVDAYGVAVDSAGDVFIPDLNGNQVSVINKSQPPALSFATTNVNSTSSDSPQSFTIQNVGNQTLVAAPPGLVVNPPNFVEVAGPGTPADCSSTFSLTPGAACNLSIDFEPQTGGNPLHSSAVFTDNALNANPAVQTIALSGVGVAPSYTLTLTESGSGTGTVTDNQGQISCSEATGTETGTCAGSYPSGTMVTLTATGTSTFLGWGGACASAGTSPTCSLTMNSAANATASFALENFGTVNVCPAGQTTSAPCNNTLSLTYDATANITIGAVEVVTQGATGLDFTLGTGSTCTGAISAGNSCTVNVVFAPLAPGLRMGAVELFDNSANLLATMPIYGIGQGAAIAFGPGTQTTVPASGLHYNVGLALDGAGDLFIADYKAGEVVKVTPSGVQTTVAASGLSAPVGVAVDGAGNIFIVDLNLPYAVKITPGGVQTTVGSGLGYPIGIAVDGAGDVFIGDQNNKRVVEVTPNGVQTTVPASGLNQPWGVAVDGAGDVFIADGVNSRVVKVTPSGVQTTVPTTGLNQPYGVAVDAAGDVFIADPVNKRVVEVPAVGGPQTTVGSGLNYPSGLVVDGAGDVFIADQGSGEVFKVSRSLPPSLSFALTNVGSTSVDSPQLVTVQNVGNQPLTGSLLLTPGTNFTQNLSLDCSGAFPLAPSAICNESFSFTPQATGYLSGTAAFSDNTLNLSTLVSLQTINLSGNGGLNGQPVGVAVPNVVGLTQTAATTAVTGVGLALGTVSTGTSSIVPTGGVIAENPAAGTQVNSGSAVQLLVSTGQSEPPEPNPLLFENNYFVTGDYASAGVTLRGTGMGGIATGTITIPDSTTNPGVSQGVPDGADIIDAFLYWETLENTPSPSATSGTFDKYSISGQQIGNDLPNYSDGTFTGTLRAYRADVNAYFAAGANGVRLASGAHTVSLPDGGTGGIPLTEGASLVIIYRALSPNFPLKSVVIYDGLSNPAGSTSQLVQGFYDSTGTGENTSLFAGGGVWNNSSGSVAPSARSNQFTTSLNPGNAYSAVILSTPVTNTDNDGILDAWKAGPPAGDFHAGQPGYYDVKTGSWVALPGAKSGQKDLFVQLDYMCGGVLSPGVCDPSKENLFPSPDAQGNDPLAMVQQAYATAGIQLHLQIGNAVPEETCTDNTSTNPPQLCEFPGQPGVIGWKNSLEFSKLWPRNLASCAAGGDCTIRFQYGQKDSYHYVLFGHSLAIPAWNTRYGTLTSIQVVSGVTTIGTADRGNGINSCPSRITISGVLGNPSLNGVYNTTGCTSTTTITVATPGVPNWSYPNPTLNEPIIGLTSGTITSISGYSDLGGADSAVTLGLWLTAPNQDMSKRANVLAGTLYHEIGHTLSLTHGGLYYDTSGSYIPTFEANCKPNYQSVMNYLFQLDLLGPNKAVAYSNQTLIPLNENTVSGVLQLTDLSNNAATFPTSAWYVPYTSGALAAPATMHCDGTPLNGGLAYRVDASIAPITPAWTNGQDINFDGQLNTLMRGYNDQAGIDLRQVGATGGEFASLANVLSFGSSSAPLNIGAGGTVALGSGGTVALGSGGTVALGSGGSVTLSSAGTITMASGGTVALGSGGTVALGSGGTVALGSGGTVALGSGGTVTLSSGGTIALGSGGTVALGSGGTVTLSSGGTIALGSGGTVTIPSTGGTYTFNGSGTITPNSGGTVALGSGGTVTLGGAGTIALGSGGTVALGSGGTVTLGSLGGTVTPGSGGTVALGSGGTVTLGGAGTIALGSGGTVALGSGGTVALGSGGTVTLGGGGTVALGSGGTVALGSGGTATLGAGGTVALGSGGTVALGSSGAVTLSSGGTIALGSGGTVALGSGGTVTLSSGGTIALGSGGTVTVGSGGSYTINSSGGTITPNSGGTVALGSGGTVTLSGGGTIALGSGGTVALGSGGTVALGSGGIVALGSGGTLALGAGGTVALGSGGTVALGSGGTIALGSGGTVALGSGGTVALGSGGATSTELTYETANSIVRPPASPTETPTQGSGPSAVRVDWTAPTFGVVGTYTIYRSSNGATPIVIGSVSGVSGNPPATTFTDTNPDLTSPTVVYTISTTLLPVPIDPTQRQSAPSPPAVLKNDQTINLGPLPSSVNISVSQTTVTATALSGGVPNGLQVNFSATGPCMIASQSIASNISSATVTLNSTGTCTITASQTGTNTYNAAIAVSGAFTILPQSSGLLPQTITFAPLPAVQYGSTFTFSASSSAPAQTVTFSASGPCTTSGTTTGAGVCKITASTLGNSTYSAASVVQSFAVYPAVLKVTAYNLTGTYGQSQLPQLTYSYSGFVNNDPNTVVSGIPALSTTATTASNAGSYPITVTTGSLAAANYSFLYVTGTLTIQPASQTIVFTINPPASAAYNSGFTVAATGGASGNAVTFTSAGACGVTGTTPGTATYSMTSGTGPCSVIANQAGNSNYAAATPVTLTVNSTLAVLTVTFTGAPASATYNSHFTVATTTNASTTPTITSTGACSNVGTAVTMTSGTGTCSLTATWAADNNYSGTAASQSTLASKIAPTVTFTGAPASAAYNNHFTVASTTNASTTATITGSGSCSNVGTAVTMTSGTGTCSLTATWAADNNYSGTAASQSTLANKITPTVTFTGAPASAAYKSVFTVASTTSASTTAVIASSGGCSNSGLIVTMTSGTGTCSLTATWAADNNYSGTTASQSTLTSKIAPTVTFTGAPASAAYKSVFTVATTTNASNTATITGSGACSNAGNAVTMTSGTSTCSLTATWAADNNYSSATLTQSTTATQLSQTITFTTNPPSSAAYNTSFSVAATGGASGDAVIFTSSGACSNSGATYTMTNSTGTCSVIANQAANSNYAAAPQITKTVTANGPLVTVSPSTINFGSVSLGSITTKNITVTNIGTASVTINQPLISIVKGGNSNEFVAVSLCPTPLAAGKNCTVTIAFVAGPFYTPQTATLQIMDNAPGSPQPVTLSATVLIPQAITFTTNPPASATFKSSFTVVAPGGASGNAVTFTSSGSCSNSGATYTMTSGTGTCSVIANQAGNSSYAAAAQVTKTVTATYPLASLSPTSLSFGTVSTGKSSTPKTVTLSNPGTTPLIISSIGVTGANASSFVQTNTCPSPSSSLAAGKSCTISVTFNSSGKAATASLTVTDNTQAGTQTASLSGN
jgi:sugar lactone lactonase YvrE